MQITDNLSEEDIISGAVVRYCSLDIYEAIRKDREQDKRKGKAEKWKAKLAHCKWVACWRVLRRSDNFSRAANITDDLSVDVDDSSDEDAESGSKSSPSTRNKGYQRRTCGIKAAKLIRSEDAGMEREVKASTAAVDKLTAVQREGPALCFFDSPAMRNTPEAANYRRAVMQKMMASAGLPEKPAPPTPPKPTPPKPAKTKPVTDILVVEVDDGVAALDLSSSPADAMSSAPPAPASGAGANSPPGEDPPAASVAADTTAAATALIDKAATPAAPATQRSGGGDNQRGRKSQATKQLAASAALNKPLETTRGLEHSSESDTKTKTTADTE